MAGNHNENLYWKKHHCQFCFKFFKRVTDLAKHEQIHGGENNTDKHHCQYCLKYFRRVADVARHERIHTGEKPYSCNHCEKKFTEISALRKHERIVHSLETSSHICKICKKAFLGKALLADHLQSHF